MTSDLCTIFLHQVYIIIFNLNDHGGENCHHQHFYSYSSFDLITPSLCVRGIVSTHTRRDDISKLRKKEH